MRRSTSPPSATDELRDAGQAVVRECDAVQEGLWETIIERLGGAEAAASATEDEREQTLRLVFDENPQVTRRDRALVRKAVGRWAAAWGQWRSPGGRTSNSPMEHSPTQTEAHTLSHPCSSSATPRSMGVLKVPDLPLAKILMRREADFPTPDEYSPFGRRQSLTYSLPIYSARTVPDSARPYVAWDFHGVSQQRRSRPPSHAVVCPFRQDGGSAFGSSFGLSPRDPRSHFSHLSSDSQRSGTVWPGHSAEEGARRGLEEGEGAAWLALRCRALVGATRGWAGVIFRREEDGEVLVTDSHPGGPAAVAGLLSGDVVCIARRDAASPSPRRDSCGPMFSGKYGLACRVQGAPPSLQLKAVFGGALTGATLVVSCTRSKTDFLGRVLGSRTKVDASVRCTCASPPGRDDLLEGLRELRRLSLGRSRWADLDVTYAACMLADAEEDGRLAGCLPGEEAEGGSALCEDAFAAAVRSVGKALRSPGLVGVEGVQRAFATLSSGGVVARSTFLREAGIVLLAEALDEASSCHLSRADDLTRQGLEASIRFGTEVPVLSPRSGKKKPLSGRRTRSAVHTFPTPRVVSVPVGCFP
eukprot:Hpha_TRINITY_DN1451_c0_g1::TRINITY_DN1451_c0_g1_i2::g.9675::m.9675